MVVSEELVSFFLSFLSSSDSRLPAVHYTTQLILAKERKK